MGGDKVSTIRIFALVLSVLAVLPGGCASTGPSPEVQRLQAQNSYERGLSFMKERQAGPALGVLLLELGSLDQAIVQLSKAVEVDPRLADAHFHLGTALAEARRWEDAVPAYRRAVGLPSLTVPDYAYQNLGLALFHVRKYAEAEQALRFALSLDPKLQAAHYNLGLVLTAQKRPEEAKESFRRARQLAPDSPFGQAAFERLRAMGDRR
jgi:tetratricopeptide (TPR) repeat protein